MFRTRNVDSCDITVDLDLIVVTGFVVYFFVVIFDVNDFFGVVGFGFSTNFVIFDTVAVVDLALTEAFAVADTLRVCVNVPLNRFASVFDAVAATFVCTGFEGKCFIPAGK